MAGNSRSHHLDFSKLFMKFEKVKHEVELKGLKLKQVTFEGSNKAILTSIAKGKGCYYR